MKQEKQAVLFNTTCHSLGRGSSADLTNKEEAPNKGALGAALRSGFTLIELLVVVLIIGILAAVALPQYQKAVAKSRLANQLLILNAVKQAEEAYYLANNDYTVDLTSLDLEFDCNYPNTGDKSIIGCDSYFLMDAFEINNTQSNYAYLTTYYCPGKITTWSKCQSDADFQYRVYLEHSSKPNQRSCKGYSDFGKKVCKGM